MAFLEGFIDIEETAHAVSLIGEQISPGSLLISQEDERNTLYAVDLNSEPQEGTITDDDTFHFGGYSVGSIYPDEGVYFSGTTEATGSIYPRKITMRWIQDSAAMGIGISR